MSQVHPLTVQCYKTAACFATCWLALLAVPLRFTWWGTAGAAIWVRPLCFDRDVHPTLLNLLMTCGASALKCHCA